VARNDRPNRDRNKYEQRDTPAHAEAETQAQPEVQPEEVMTNSNEADAGNQFIEHTQAPAAPTAGLANIPVPPAPAGGTSGGGVGGAGRIMITNPVNGQQVNRTDYMRALAAAGWTRPQIHKHLVELTNDTKLRYQTVFQAVKGLYPTRERQVGTHESTAPQAPTGGAVNVEEVAPQV
jgi:hypothetical protein